MLFLNIVLSCLLLTSSYVNSVPCEYIEDVITGEEDTEGVLDNPTNTRYCTFYGYESTVLDMRNSTIGILRENAVRNMPWLTAIHCIYCEIDLIEPGAFQNVSNIMVIDFFYGVIPKIRRGIFNVLPKLIKLNLGENKINNIDDEAFSNMPALEHLYLNGNELEYWRREWFTNTTNIKLVHFVGNQLRSIPSLAFADFRSVEELLFENNKITVIHRDAFKGIEHIDKLGLANNRLKTLSDTSFPNKIKITTFDITDNELNYIPRELLRKLTVEYLWLDGNPWKCPCLNEINNWLDLTGGSLDDGSKIFGMDPIWAMCKGPQIPVCVSSLASTCSEIRDEELTRRYLSHAEVIKRKNTLCLRF